MAANVPPHRDGEGKAHARAARFDPTSAGIALCGWTVARRDATAAELQTQLRRFVEGRRVHLSATLTLRSPP